MDQENEQQKEKRADGNKQAWETLKNNRKINNSLLRTVAHTTDQKRA
jgi:hypothetical protein